MHSRQRSTHTTAFATTPIAEKVPHCTWQGVREGREQNTNHAREAHEPKNTKAITTHKFAKASRSRPPSYFSSFPAPSNHLRARSRNILGYEPQTWPRETRTWEASHAELLAERLANTIRVDLSDDDFVLLVGESIRQLLVDGCKVLRRKDMCESDILGRRM